jgi:hypothetical protein
LRRATSCAALIKQNDAVLVWIKKASMIGFTAGAGAAVHEQNRDPLRVSRFFNMQHMWRFDRQAMYHVRLDGRV